MLHSMFLLFLLTADDFDAAVPDVALELTHGVPEAGDRVAAEVLPVLLLAARPGSTRRERVFLRLG